MKLKIYAATLFSITLVLFSCGDKEKNNDVKEGDAVPVKVSSLTMENNANTLSASGTVEAVKSANISTRMMGYVNKIYVEIGNQVKQGQLLLSINNADLSAKLAQANASIIEAEASFNNAGKDFERFTALYGQNSTSQKELDDVTTRYNMAKARLEAAKEMKNEVEAQFSYANIRAPFSGVVTNKFIKMGDLANPGMPLLEVESPENFQVMAMVTESNILQIKKGTKVQVLIKSTHKTVSGKVTEVSTSAKNTGGQYLVKVMLNDTDTELLSGMYATVQFPLEGKSVSESVFLPKEALVTNGQLSGVYTVSQSNTAILRWLRLGRTVGDQVEVLSGLSPEETYILSSEGRLYNGAKISVQ